MALNATVYNFDVTLSDVDREIYEELKIKAARHPSESMAYLITRVLAYCLQYRPGISFSKGLSEPDSPAIWAHDLTGRLTLWLEIGNPTPERLHKATKLGAEVIVYTHKDPRNLMLSLSEAKIFRSAEVKIYTLPQSLLQQLEPIINRRTSIVLSLSDGVMYLTIGSQDFSCEIEPLSIA